MTNGYPVDDFNIDPHSAQQHSLCNIQTQLSSAQFRLNIHPVILECGGKADAAQSVSTRLVGRSVFHKAQRPAVASELPPYDPLRITFPEFQLAKDPLPMSSRIMPNPTNYGPAWMVVDSGCEAHSSSPPSGGSQTRSRVPYRFQISPQL